MVSFPSGETSVTRDKLMSLMSSNTNHALLSGANACSLLINTTVFNGHEEISEASEPGSLSNCKFMTLAEES